MEIGDYFISTWAIRSHGLFLDCVPSFLHLSHLKPFTVFLISGILVWIRYIYQHDVY